MYQICVSGSSGGASAEEAKELARAVGRELARSGLGLITGATSGLPEEAAIAYKKAGGKMCVGLSPAVSKIEHTKKYRLPTEPFDVIIYSGMNYVGRDALLINSCDGMVSIGGRMGTLHEFTIAMELNVPTGFMQGAGGISTEIKTILDIADENKSRNVVFSDDPAELIADLIKLIDR
jgi:uncharacterized protein (TIGR00725 family)